MVMYAFNSFDGCNQIRYDKPGNRFKMLCRNSAHSDSCHQLAGNRIKLTTLTRKHGNTIRKSMGTCWLMACAANELSWLAPPASVVPPLLKLPAMLIRCATFITPLASIVTCRGMPPIAHL